MHNFAGLPPLRRSCRHPPTSACDARHSTCSKLAANIFVHNVKEISNKLSTESSRIHVSVIWSLWLGAPSHPQPCSDLHGAGGVATEIALARRCTHEAALDACFSGSMFSSWLVQLPCSCKIPCLCSVPWTSWTGDRPWDGCRSLPRLGDCIECIGHARICYKLNTLHYHRSTSQNRRIICFWRPRNEEMVRSGMNPSTFTFILLPLPHPGVFGCQWRGGPRQGVSGGGLRGLGGGAEGSRRTEGLKFRAFFLLPPQMSFFPLSVFFFLWNCSRVQRHGPPMCVSGLLWGPAVGSPVEGSGAVQWRGKKGEKMKNRKTFTKNKSKEASKPNPR